MNAFGSMPVRRVWERRLMDKRDPPTLDQHRVALELQRVARDRKFLFLLAAVLGMAVVLFSASTPPTVETHASPATSQQPAIAP